MFRRLKSYWSSTSLAKQFALMSLFVLVAGMFTIGSWVSEKIETGVINSTAFSAALYLNSFVVPELQELSTRKTLSDETIAALDRLYRETALNQRIESFKVWDMEGRVLYSDNPAIIGRVFPVSPSKHQAWKGRVVAEFSGLEYAEHILERGIGVPLLEIYSPVRAQWDNRVIAVAEFYDNATLLTRQLSQARLESWLVVGGVTGMMFVLLFGIVRGGSRTIARQQSELHGRVKQLSELLGQNNELHRRIGNATRRTVELNERFLRRLGTELHDGPAQVLGYGLLQLDTLAAKAGACECGKPVSAAGSDQVETLRNALGDALQEIRNLSTGLAVPELAELDLPQALEHVVQAHRRRTGSEVELRLQAIPQGLELPQKIGLYRLVQEGLNNAYQHGNGEGQRVQARCDGTTLEVEVVDRGPGFDPAALAPGQNERLGLSGMRERIESLGGQFIVESALGNGTRVVARLAIRTSQAAFA